MTATLWVTLIIGIATPICTLLGVIVANNKANKKQSSKLDEHNNLIIYRIKQLEEKQDKHNNHTERLYNLEGKVKELAQEMNTVRNHLLNK
jgi:uncharacterized protein YlxW (UPF0749 family)